MKNELLPEHQPCFEEVEVGTALPAQVNSPTTVTLFRFSALTWNAHRIHYDTAYAREEGHRDVLVQAHLHGAYLARTVTDWMGPRGHLLSIGWKNRRRAYPSDVLTCNARVLHKEQADGLNKVHLEITESNQDGEVCASGTAVVALPARQQMVPQ